MSVVFFEQYAFIILTSTLVLAINYFVIITRPLHPIPIRKRSNCSCFSYPYSNVRVFIINFFELYAFIILTSTLVLGINTLSL